MKNKLYISIFLLFALNTSVVAQTQVSSINKQDTLWFNSHFKEIKKTNYPKYFLQYKKNENGRFQTKLYCIYKEQLCEYPEPLSGPGTIRLIEEGFMLSTKPLVRYGEFKIYNVDGRLIETKTYINDTLKYANPKWGCDVNRGMNNIFDYFAVKHMPKFPGGEEALAAYLKNNIRYPKELEGKDIHGLVYVRFIIDRYGTVSKPEIIKAINEYLDNEALRLIKSLPDWHPAKDNNGKTLNVYFIIPVKF